MVAESWRWQGGTSELDQLDAVALGPDGSLVVGGWTRGVWDEVLTGFEDPAAIKFASNGTLLWRYQSDQIPANNNGSVRGVAVGQDGSVVLGISSGSGLVATKLDANGGLLWHSQDGLDGQGNGAVEGVALTEDESIVLSGFSPDGFLACKLDSDGTLQWVWENGTDGSSEDEIETAAVGSDGSVILTGHSEGVWGGVNAGGFDLVAVKLDLSDGAELWRWQDGTSQDDKTFAASIDADGSIILAGETDGNWDGVSNGKTDFAVVKLDADGSEVWRWQGGTEEGDYFFGSTVAMDGSVFLVGYTWGEWNDTQAGNGDLVAVRLDGSDGTELWRFQDGSNLLDMFLAAATSPSGQLVFAGFTQGNWEESNLGSSDFAILMMDLDTSYVMTPPPSSAATTTPTVEPTVEPTPSPSSVGPAPTPTIVTWTPFPSNVEMTPTPSMIDSKGSPPSVETTVMPSSTAMPTPLPGEPTTSAPVTPSTPNPVVEVVGIVGGVVGSVALLITIVACAMRKCVNKKSSSDPQSPTTADGLADVGNTPGGLSGTLGAQPMVDRQSSPVPTFSIFHRDLQSVSEAKVSTAYPSTVTTKTDRGNDAMYVKTSIHHPREVQAFETSSVPNEREAWRTAGAVKAIPQLDLEDLEFQGVAGRGGMGVVRKAVYRRGAEVAVKELPETRAEADHDFFVREIELHFRIPYFPHIVPVVGVTRRSKTDCALRLVTDWCNGGSLQDLLDDAFGGDRKKVVTFGDALRYARHIAAGVDHLHQHELLHLDLKPSNVMLDKADDMGKARLTDFGLSKIISKGGQTSNRFAGGTHGFMAPEVIQPATSKELRKGAHTDVFAMGVTIFLLFFGLHRPYRPGIPGPEISRQVYEGLRPEFPEGFFWPGESHVTEKVKGLIQKCWASDPRRRPSAADVLDVLHRIGSMVEGAEGMDQEIHPQSLPGVSSFII